MIILTYKVTINRFFAQNLKIGRLLRSMIRSYDPQSYLPPTILRRIPILTTLGWTVGDPLLVGMSGLRNLRERERERESSSFFLLARRWTSYLASPGKILLTNLKKHSIGLACSYPKELWSYRAWSKLINIVA